MHPVVVLFEVLTWQGKAHPDPAVEVSPHFEQLYRIYQLMTDGLVLTFTFL